MILKSEYLPPHPSLSPSGERGRGEGLSRPREVGMKKYIIVCLIMVISAGFYLKAISAEQEMTGGKFVKQLIESMELQSMLKPDATANDCINVLKEKGLVFPADFDPTKPISNELKSNLLSQILKVEEGEKTQMEMEIYRNKAVIKKMEGDVTVKFENTNEWVPAKIGMELTEGNYIKTGPGSTVLLAVGIAGRIEIKENSELLLKNIGTQADGRAENILMYLAMGEASFDVRFIDKNTIFETHTPTTVAAVRGTIYIVKVDPTKGKTEIREEKK